MKRVVLVFVLCSCGSSDEPASSSHVASMRDAEVADVAMHIDGPDHRKQDSKVDGVDDAVDAIEDDSSVHDAVAVSDVAIDRLAVDVSSDVAVVDVAADVARDTNSSADASVDVDAADCGADATGYDVRVRLPIGCGQGMRYTVQLDMTIRDNENNRVWKLQNTETVPYAKAVTRCTTYSYPNFSLPTVAQFESIAGDNWATCAFGGKDIFAWAALPTTTDKATIFMTMNYGKGTALKLVSKTLPAHYMCVATL